MYYVYANYTRYRQVVKNGEQECGWFVVCVLLFYNDFAYGKRDENKS